MMKDIATRRVLMIADDSVENSEVICGALEALADELAERGVVTVHAPSYAEARPMIENDMDFDAILLSTDMKLNNAEESAGRKLLRRIDERQSSVPVFLLADRADTAEALSDELMKLADEFVWIFEDSPMFIAGRIESAIARFREELFPPLMRAVWEYNESNHEYSWAAPGHQGGRGFTKSPAGKKFYDFYGENLFRTDTGIERSSIGSLLDHSGAFGESEKMAAKVFGADRSYSVVVGTSGSNRTVMQACIAEREPVLCDRNCHKSIEQGLILTGAVPLYMLPTRNRYGIIGPILRREMSPEAVCRKLGNVKVDHVTPKGPLSYAVVTNCTYDGVCYNSAKVEGELEKSSDRIHMDEAWYGYARFNPLYKDHYAMRGSPSSHKGPTVFATHSTHKLLNALSQASYIHVRNGRRPILFERMNQSYMLHATTSPLYAICVSNDISVKMMDECGKSLTQEVIDDAVDFRQAMARLYREFTDKGSWFFKPWNPDKVTCPRSGKIYDFADAPRELLTREQSVWRLAPGDNWHGFKDLEDNWVLLDPIKVSILGPGMGDDGNLLKTGVPSALVSSYIYDRGIVPTRTTDFQLMFLFSMGITRGKWCTLINELLKFKEFYDRNAPVSEVLPGLAKAYPAAYGEKGIRDLGDRMFEYIREHKPGEKLDAAFADLPEMAMTPHDAFLAIVRDEVETVPSDKLAGRVTANSIIPYPPGIPMLMSGERFGTDDCPQIGYLHALEAWDREFPGFEHVTEGSTVENGRYCVMCVREK
ncbi:MAG: arginine decarboxylase [Victivallaceae bacterium]|nr:arginine decarboxylase [Victivallaceae bacterium]